MLESGCLAYVVGDLKSSCPSRHGIEIEMERQENSFLDRHPWSLHPKMEKRLQQQSSECR